MENNDFVSSSLPRIAMISTHGYVAAVPPLGNADTGGQVVYVLELSKKLADLGFEVDVWTRRFEDQPEMDTVSERVRVIRVPCGGDDFIPKEYLVDFLGEWCENALAFIRSKGLTYKFLNCHYWDAAFAGDILSQKLGVPLAVTPHSLGSWKQRQMEHDYPGNQDKLEKQYNFNRRITDETRLFGKASLVVATTPEQFDYLLQDYKVEKSKVCMIPPGYDDTRFFPVSESSRKVIRERLGFHGETVLALGRLARNKGYDLLIEAFKVVVERVPDARLLLAVGGANLNSDEEALLNDLKLTVLRLNLRDHVDFGHFIRDEDLADYYRAADIFALSSRYEPFGMTAVEAMACGTPSVITTHGGLHRATSFGRHALFADPFDATAFGITITQIFQHQRMRDRLSSMGAHRVRSLFTWTGIANQLMAKLEGDSSGSEVFEDDRWDDPWVEEG